METLATQTDSPPEVKDYPDLGTSTFVRCDKCNVQAFMAASKGELELFFCGHHGREYEVTLAAGGWDIFDRTHKINEKPTPSTSPDDD